MHVLTLTPFFPSAEDEVNGCFVAEPIERLKELGVECSVIAAGPVYYPRRRMSSRAPARWVRYLQLPGPPGLATAGNFLHARLRREVRKLHREKPLDLIHAHSALPCGHAASLLSDDLKVPFVVTVHGLDVFNTCYRSGITANWRRKVSSNVYRTARTVICVSGKVQEILKEGIPGGVPSAVVHNGVDPERFAPPANEIGEQNPELLIVGNLLRSKGHELALRALADLQSSFSELRLCIIGDGPDRAFFESLVHELGLTQRVRFVGRQGRAEVADAMRNCAIFLLPSRNESFGCVYLEAMSCAKPVIGCHGQGIDEVIQHGENGWLIPVNGREELALAISTLLKSQELSRRIGASARQTILDGLTLSHQAERLLTVYRGAITETQS